MWLFVLHTDMRWRLKEENQPLLQNLCFILCLPHFLRTVPFLSDCYCVLLHLFLPKIGIEYPHKTHIDTHTDTSAHIHMGARAQGATDSSETAADSSQSHEASLQLMWLIHKKRKKRWRKTLINAAPLSQAAHCHRVPWSKRSLYGSLCSCQVHRKKILSTVSIFMWRFYFFID